MGPTLPIIQGLGIVGGLVQGFEASAQAKEADEARQRIASIQNKRQIRQQLRQARQQRATAINTAESQNTAGGSAVQGTTASITSDAAANTSFVTGIQDLSDQASFANQQSRDATDLGNLFNTVGSAAGKFFDPETMFRSFQKGS